MRWRPIPSGACRWYGRRATKLRAQFGSKCFASISRDYWRRCRRRSRPAGVNISTAEVKTAGNDGRALSLFELKVTNAAQLNNLMHSIAAIDGVMRVSRLGQQNGANHHRV